MDVFKARGLDEITQRDSVGKKEKRIRDWASEHFNRYNLEEEKQVFII